jgi:flavin reductase (DIM6/NTAB) family NADH-FMN oxidoreductase RutF
MQPLAQTDTTSNYPNTPRTADQDDPESADYEAMSFNQEKAGPETPDHRHAELMMPPIDQTLFRHVLGHFASSVTVVTTSYNNVDHGSPVSAFCSLSLEPPLVLVCINHHTLTHTLIAQAGLFVVNILGEDGEYLSRHFASRNMDKFVGIAYRRGVTGMPLLEEALATIECRLVNQFPGGDHSIFVGEVISAHAADGCGSLLYYRGGYRRLA